MARTTSTRKSTAKKRSVTRATQKKSLFSRRRNLFISIGVGLVVFLVGAYLLATWAASSYVSFVGVGGKCLDNNAQRAINGNKIQLWDCNGSKAQQWKAGATGTIGSIVNANNLCLDVKNGGKTRGTIVWLYSCNNSGAQKWQVNSNGTIVNPQSSLCLDSQNGGTANGNQIQIWSCNGSAAQKWTTPAPSNGARKNFIMNAGPGDVSKVQALGYNVIDATPGEINEINKLPAGVQAMVWVGGAQCEAFSYPFNSFKSFVNAQRNNSKIYGYFLYDEPKAQACSKYVDLKDSSDDIKGRADYIHCLSNDASKVNAAGECLESGKVVARKTDKKAFIIDEYDFAYDRVSKAKTHVDLFGIDPYPCRPNGCKYSGDPDYFKERIARAKQYYSQANIVPVYQTFGGDGWKMPTADQLKTALSEYDKSLSGTLMDASYTWKQNTGGQNAALGQSTSLQQVMKDHNARY